MKAETSNETFPLSPLQQGMLFHSLLAPNSGVNIEQLVFEFDDHTVVAIFKNAWKLLVKRHRVLRTSYLWEGLSQPEQLIQNQAELLIAEYDWGEAGTEQQKILFEEYLDDDRRQDFDLAKAPLARLAIITIGGGNFKCVFSYHHILFDYQSLTVILKELFIIYDALTRDESISLAPPHTNQDYITWVQERDQAAAQKYWHEKMKGYADRIAWDAGSAQTKSESRQSYSECFIQIPQEISSSLRALAERYQYKLEILFEGAWALLLSRYNQDSAVVIGVTRSCRNVDVDVDAQVGMYINALPLMVTTAPEMLISYWLNSLGVLQSELEKRKFDPLMDIKKWSDMPDDGQLFSTLVNFETHSLEQTLLFSGVKSFANSFLLFERTNYPLTLSIYDDQQIQIKITYDESIFDVMTISRMGQHLVNLLAEIVFTPDSRLLEISYLTDEEQAKLLVDWNDTQDTSFADMCVHQMFEEQVLRTPNAVAIRYHSIDGAELRETLTYQELNQRANQVAHYLQTLDIGPDILVGISMDQSVEMICAVLGVLKAGAGYVPVDPAYPHERIAFMLQDSQIPILMTKEFLLDRLPSNQARVFCLDRDWNLFEKQPQTNPACDVASGDIAYVIYTSGSTGKPKGVILEHSALSNLILWQLENSRLKEGARTLQFTSLSFDVSFQEIFSTWCAGGELILISDELRRDFVSLLRFIDNEAIERLFLPFTALHHLAQTGQILDLVPKSLREVNTAGEQLQINTAIRNFFQELDSCTLTNQYGPSESHVVTAHTLSDDPEKWPTLPPIGRPISNAQMYILDQHLSPVPIGVAGELHIAGVCLARGYLHRPDLTSEKFISNPFHDDPDARLYKTGDLARYLPDGNIEFLGRMDNQVKVRGYRIEPGEVESVLDDHPDVKESVVALNKDDPNTGQLVAYLVSADGNPPNADQLRDYLRGIIPNYMIPAHFLEINAIPVTPSGKVNRKELPALGRPPAATRQGYIAPHSKSEVTLASLWAQLLKLDRVGIYDNFFEIGGNSLLCIQVVAGVKSKFDVILPIVKIFQFPTVSSLAAHLDYGEDGQEALRRAKKPIRRRKGKRRSSDREVDGVAIIGMAARYPGANSAAEFWQNIVDGIESISFFSDDELREHVDDVLMADPDYVRARGIIEDEDKFDAQFFGINPRLAEVMDPQQRVFLEIAWAAFEDAGYDTERFAGLIGVYAGMGYNAYYTNNVLTRPDRIAALGDFQTMLANDKDYLTTQISYRLNLNGPSVSIHTACSTSLVAIAQAFYSLASYQCDMALAGGVSITVPQKSGYLYQDGGMLSTDGYTRAFDAQASGTVFGNGAGAVILKRLDDAIEDQDRIYAVIRGVGVNNDGADKVSFTAPSVDGQAAAIRMAHENARLHPESISYVETHGTATPLGDPIELEALTQAFGVGTNGRNFCAIGSVKSNIGHAIAAAGVAGLIKTSLSLKHKVIPPSLFFEKPNPELDFTNSPFYVNNRLMKWQNKSSPLRAGVSSFGVGGTNAHVVLEEPPTLALSGLSRPWQLILLSAKNEAVLERATENLTAFIAAHAEVNIADMAYTLQTGRREFNHRRAIVCRDLVDAQPTLKSLPAQRTSTRQIETRNAPLVFMFPGQGSQYLNMGLTIYRHETLFRQIVDQCAEIVQPCLQHDIRQVLYPDQADFDESEALLRQTFITQPAIFTVEYALARLWMSWGIRPAAMVGHSIGEFVAACLAEIFSLEDALKMVTARGKMMQELPSGAMLSVRKPAAQVEARLGEHSALSLAANNAPSLCVVSGPSNVIDIFQDELKQEMIPSSLLRTSHAFHSAMMDAVIEPFRQVVDQVKLSTPKTPLVSSVTGDWLSAEQAHNPSYWARHLRETVRFAEAIGTLWQEPGRLLLEIGPGRTMATLARQQAKNTQVQLAISSLSNTSENDAEWQALMMAIGQLWTAGVSLDWEGFYAHETRDRISLPTYPFERKRYWLEPGDRSPVVSSREEMISPTPMKERTAMQQLSPQKISRKNRLIKPITEIFVDTSGFELDGIERDITFLEMGLDSLLLTQVGIIVQNKFGVKVTFRQLLDVYPTLDSLAEYIDQQLPPDAFPAEPSSQPESTQTEASSLHSIDPLEQRVPELQKNTSIGSSSALSSTVERVINQQLQLMAEQLKMLNVHGHHQSDSGNSHPDPEQKLTDENKPAVISKKIRTKKGAFTPAQKSSFDALARRYLVKTSKSKQATQEHRSYLADPRTVSGFSPLLKEIVYPIVGVRSSGSKIWDIDGNEYVDLLNGFGSNFFGHSPAFLTEALKAQIATGIEIGPQTPLAGDVAKLIADLVNLERVSFSNTGTEAVMGAMRLARTATGRNMIVIFSGAYHGHTDEVIVRGTKPLRSLPAAPGIPIQSVENVLVLDYGTNESLEIIRSRAAELAAILVEPVQSRRPDLQPRTFLHELRTITEDSGTALIFDEVITGFRVHQGGAQAFFDIQADLATYGKVIGGGLSIGVIAGKPGFMDALDGGYWQFGDDSVPEAGVTYFAGTFVRHPLVLAAAKAALEFLKREGPELQTKLNKRTDQMVQQINYDFQRVSAPIHIDNFGSMMYMTFSPEFQFGELLYYWLRLKGVHIWDQRPFFLTLAHTDEDIQFVIDAFKDSVEEMMQAGFLDSTSAQEGKAIGRSENNLPPVLGAKLGKDPQGNPAWFISDPDRPGKFIKVADV